MSETKAREFDSFRIGLLNGLDYQELDITDQDEAREVASRLKFFFAKQGLDVIVSLDGITHGEAQYDSDGEYIYSKDDSAEELNI